jgi:pimeloyl-ACP methyl ester carboxylesterase
MKKVMYLLLFIGLVLSCNRSAFTSGEVLYLRHKGADMPAYVYGNTSSNTFILLLHGGPGGSGLEYRSGIYAEMLEEEVGMIYWDQRGQGNAQGNNPEEAVSMELLLDDLDQLVLAIKAKYGKDISLFLMGHSWGGTYGTSYLMEFIRQQHFKGWIEANGAHDIPRLNVEAVKMFIEIGEDQVAQGKNTDKWTEILDWAKEVDTSNITEDDGSRINNYGHEAEELLDEVLPGNDDGIPSALLSSPLDPLASLVSGNNTSGLLVESGIEEIALTDSLYKINIPSLLLWGKYDFVVPPQLGIDAHKLISSPEKRFILYEASGHSPMNGEGEAFAADILDFVNTYK